jgi:hypothetical protein
MKILSSIQNNLSGNYYGDQRESKILNKTDDEMDFLTNARALAKTDKSEKILSNNEKNTLHLFFGTKVPDDMKLYGQNNIKQIHKGKLLDLRG